MNTSFQNVSLFAPPYRTLQPFDPAVNLNGARGQSIVWYLHDAAAQRSEYDCLLHRSPRVPLFVVLPPAGAIGPILSIIPQLNDLHARGVLPNGPLEELDSVRMLLTTPPRDIPAFMVSYFTRRRLLRDAKARSLVHRIFELAPTVPSITTLARRLCTSRRTLGRFFEAQGLPVPSHWLQFARLLNVAITLQSREEVAVFRIATQFGYPDGFTMSNQMKRLVGCRPTDVRENLGYEWFVEEWLEMERKASVEGGGSEDEAAQTQSEI